MKFSRQLLMTSAGVALAAAALFAQSDKLKNPAALNEVRQNGAPPLGANGFVPPSLLSIFAFPQTFFHNGAALSLDDVLNNVQHRSAGTAGVDTLSSAADRAKVTRFLLSIDAATAPIP